MGVRVSSLFVNPSSRAPRPPAVERVDRGERQNLCVRNRVHVFGVSHNPRDSRPRGGRVCIAVSGLRSWCR